MKKVPKGALTIIEKVYHRIQGENPTVEDMTFEQDLESDEQVFQRRCKISEDPEPLNLGWYTDKPEEIRYLLIANNEGRFQVQPSKEEKAEASKKILLLGYSLLLAQGWLIRPGDFFRGSPSSILSLQELRIQSLSGTIQFTITVYPK